MKGKKREGHDVKFEKQIKNFLSPKFKYIYNISEKLSQMDSRPEGAPESETATRENGFTLQKQLM